MNISLNKTINLFYQWLQIFFAFDYGFFDYKSCKMKFIAKFLCLIQCAFICLTLFSYFGVPPMGLLSYYWHIGFLTQYAVYIIILTFNRSDTTLFQFQCVTKTIDLNLKTHNAYNFVEKRKIMTMCFFVAYRSILTWHQCTYNGEYCLKPLWISICFCSVLLSMDLILVNNTFLFYSINYRLKILTSDLKDASNNFTHFHNVYKLIVDVAEKYKSAYDITFLVALLYNVPQMMISIFYSVCDTRQSQTTSMWILPLKPENLAVVINVAVTLLPAVVAGKLCKQAHTIKVALNEKLLMERDQSKRYELQKFIRYIEARPLKFAVYQVIPLNSNLIGLVINFAVTYLIVMIQFTHLY